MKSRVHKVSPQHEVLYQELAALIGRHGDNITAEEMLAIAANVVGKILALQDQHTMTPERGMEIVIRNIEHGNQQVLTQLLESKGSA